MTPLLLAAALAAPPVPPPTDPAALFPASALAYAELVRPGDVLPAVAAAVAASPLADSVPFAHDRRDKGATVADVSGKAGLGAVGLLLSPEALADLGRVRGAAVALTGFDAQHNPQIAAAVLVGDASAVAVAARGLLTLHPTLRRVGAEGGVPIFQRRPTPVTYEGPNGRPRPQTDPPPAAGPYEPTVAYAPGLFVAGSSVPAVADVIRRFRGAEPAPSLAAAGWLRDADALRKRPGLFAAADVPALCARLDAANKAAGDVIDADAYALFKMAVGAKTLDRAAVHVAPTDAGLVATLDARVAPNAASPLLTLLAGPGGGWAALRPAPAGAVAAGGVGLPADGRAAAVLALCDAVAKANGVIGKLPSDAVAEAEGRFGVKVRDDVLAKAAAVTVVVPGAQELPAGAVPLPAVAVRFDDEAAARAGEELLRKVVAELAGGGAAEPSAEAVAGRRVWSLPGAGLPWRAPVHFARDGATLAVALDRKLVAALLAADPAASVVAGRVAPGGDGGASLAAAVSPGAAFATTAAGGKGNAAKAYAEFAAAARKLPPVLVTVRRSGDQMRADAVHPLPPAGWGPLIGKAVGWLDKALDGRSDGEHGETIELPR